MSKFLFMSMKGPNVEQCIKVEVVSVLLHEA